MIMYISIPTTPTCSTKSIMKTKGHLDKNKIVNLMIYQIPMILWKNRNKSQMMVMILKWQDLPPSHQTKEEDMQNKQKSHIHFGKKKILRSQHLSLNFKMLISSNQKNLIMQKILTKFKRKQTTDQGQHGMQEPLGSIRI